MIARRYQILHAGRDWAPIVAPSLAGPGMQVSWTGSFNSLLPGARLKSEAIVFQAKKLGRDATHRTHNLNTHLTHGCIQLLSHFSSGGSDVTSAGLGRSLGIPQLLETSHRRRDRASR